MSWIRSASKSVILFGIGLACATLLLPVFGHADIAPYTGLASIVVSCTGGILMALSNIEERLKRLESKIENKSKVRAR